jgi:hypothetical protein
MYCFRNNAIVALALAGALLPSAAALAAGAYDGTWTGKETSGGCAGTVVTITVADNVASANFSGSFQWTFHGKPIPSDDTVKWVNKEGAVSRARFMGTTFEMTSNAPCGHLSVTGSKQ